jgi:hypothetical protein
LVAGVLAADVLAAGGACDAGAVGVLLPHAPSRSGGTSAPIARTPADLLITMMPPGSGRYPKNGLAQEVGRREGFGFTIEAKVLQVGGSATGS